eukprot:TRINITY_DN1773_c7_g1_i2.p1 TRINITY_DN1773_c7_g1~~TRINITY_DN1773_c7_g1_i2.p1  ORF type:complete len:1095 (+),score=314.77 TRINITY_DN1773_c7_g1_i2:91-3375(+)
MADRVSFHVYTGWNGKKWKITLARSDLAGVRAEKIARTVSKQVRVPAADFELLGRDGTPLSPQLRGQDFGLAEGGVLRARLVRPAGGSPGKAPAGGAAPQAPTGAEGRLSPPAPEPAAGRAHSPPGQHSSEYVDLLRRSEAARGSAWGSQRWSSPGSPPQRALSRSGQLGESGQDDSTEPAPPCQAASPAPMLSGGRHGGPAAPPPLHPRSMLSPRRQPPAAPPAAPPAGPPAGPPGSPPQTLGAPPRAPEAALSPVQVQLQAQLLQEAARGGSVPRMDDILPRRPDPPAPPPPPAPAPEPAAPRPPLAPPAPPADGPSFCTPPLPTRPPEFPGLLSVAPRDGPGSVAAAAASAAALDMRIRALRAENEAMRQAQAQAQAQARRVGSPPRSGAGCASRPPSPGTASTAGRPPSPCGAPSARAQSPSGAHPAAAAVGTPPPLHPAAASSPAGSAVHQAEGDDLAALQRRCAALAAERERLQELLRGMRAELSADKRQRMQQWDAEHAAFRDRQQRIVAEWEAEKRRILSGLASGTPPAQLQRQWQEERAALLGAFARNSAAQQQLRSSDRSDWHQERAVLQGAVAELRRRCSDNQGLRLERRRGEVEQQRGRLQALAAELQGLKERLARSRHDTDQNKLFVAAAERSFGELRQALRDRLGESGEQLATAATEKAMAKEKVAELSLRHQQLAARLQGECALRKHLHNTLEDIKGHVRVIVRVRPMLPHERRPNPALADRPDAQGTLSLLDDTSVCVSTPTTGTKHYNFYRVLGGDAGQSDVFSEVSPLIQSTLDGFNVSVMAYGQTGSGKTYTILGEDGAQGVVPRALELLYGLVSASDAEVDLRCSMVELYLDQPRDLLSDDPQRRCDLRVTPAHGAHVVGATQRAVRSAGDALAVLGQGAAQRQVRNTLVNPQSSRSHLVFTTTMRIRPRDGGAPRSAKLVFVDLAGSERVKQSHSSGDQLKEAQNINKSLAALGDVVAALSQRHRGQGKQHVPYRNSKLTLLLQDALGGNAKTLLFACVCPTGPGVPSAISETVSTLLFASRVRCVQNPYLRNITKLQNSDPALLALSAQDDDRRGGSARDRGGGSAHPRWQL